MWRRDARTAPIAAFLGWILCGSLLVDGMLLNLEPYSVAFAATGTMTAGYLLYAVIGMLFSTPAPCICLFLVLRRQERIPVGAYVRRIFHTPRPVAAMLVTGGFAAAALVFALTCGVRLDAPWYLMPLGFLIMIPFVGIAEETGWRGFLQPALEARFPFPVATAMTAAVWTIWHGVLWFMPTSNHYGDSFVGFAMNILVWSFASAAIYKATKSVMACAAYHAFINAIGAVYDRNALFDAYPKSVPAMLYFALVFVASVVIWLAADHMERKSHHEESNQARPNRCLRAGHRGMCADRDGTRPRRAV